MDPGFSLRIGKLKTLTARWQQIPTQCTVPNGTLENHHGCLGRLGNRVPNPDLDSNVALDRHPLIVEQFHGSTATAHHTNVANVIPDRPIALVINQVGVQFLLVDGMLQ